MNLRTLGIVAFASLLATAACGGSTSQSQGSGGSSGSGASAGSGGSSGTGAVSGSGGVSGTGAVAGNGGSGGSSGTGAVSGSGGSGGGNPDWYSCNEPGDCELFANNCCGGYCTQVPISSYTAINTKYDSAYANASCTTGQPCPGCLAAMNPNLVALCRNSTCTGVDIRTDDLSACQTDADCELRWGSGCCAECTPGGTSDLIAVSKNANVTGAFCGSAVPPCCAPAPLPPDALSVCQAGHCQVSFYVTG